MGTPAAQYGQGIQPQQGNLSQMGNQPQQPQQYGGGPPVSAGRGFHGPMPTFNAQAFHGGGIQPQMGNQAGPQPGMNPYAAGVPSTAQFVQNYQAQQAAQDAAAAQQSVGYDASRFNGMTGPG